METRKPVERVYQKERGLFFAHETSVQVVGVQRAGGPNCEAALLPSAFYP